MEVVTQLWACAGPEGVFNASIFLEVFDRIVDEALGPIVANVRLRELQLLLATPTRQQHRMAATDVLESLWPDSCLP